MRLPYEIISGELLTESLFNNNLITQGQYDRIVKKLDDLRNENNWTLLWLGEYKDLLDESQHDDIDNHIREKAKINDIAYCYAAV